MKRSRQRYPTRPSSTRPSLLARSARTEERRGDRDAPAFGRPDRARGRGAGARRAAGRSRLRTCGPRRCTRCSRAARSFRCTSTGSRASTPGRTLTRPTGRPLRARRRHRGGDRIVGRSVTARSRSGPIAVHDCDPMFQELSKAARRSLPAAARTVSSPASRSAELIEKTIARRQERPPFAADRCPTAKASLIVHGRGLGDDRPLLLTEPRREADVRSHRADDGFPISRERRVHREADARDARQEVPVSSGATRCTSPARVRGVSVRSRSDSSSRSQPISVGREM